MAYIYFRLIQLGKKSISDVPENIRPDVIALLTEEA